MLAGWMDGCRTCHAFGLICPSNWSIGPLGSIYLMPQVASFLFCMDCHYNVRTCHWTFSLYLCVRPDFLPLSTQLDARPVPWSLAPVWCSRAEPTTMPCTRENSPPTRRLLARVSSSTPVVILVFREPFFVCQLMMPSFSCPSRILNRQEQVPPPVWNSSQLGKGFSHYLLIKWVVNIFRALYSAFFLLQARRWFICI